MGQLRLVVPGTALQARVARRDRGRNSSGRPQTGMIFFRYISRRAVAMWTWTCSIVPDGLAPRQERLGAAHHRRVVPSERGQELEPRAARPGAPSSQASRPDVVNGFSQRTLAPASSAAFARAWCALGVDPDVTALHAQRRSASSTLSVTTRRREARRDVAPPLPGLPCRRPRPIRRRREPRRPAGG